MAQYSKLQMGEIGVLTRRYDLELIGFEPIAGGASSSNFLVRTVQGEYILTVFEIEPARVEKICRLLHLLAEHDFPTTRIQKSSTGEEITSYHGKSVLLKPYIPGQVLDDLDARRISQVGTAIAKLHAIPCPDFLPGQHAYGLQTFPNLLEKGVDLAYEQWLAQRYIILKDKIPTGLPRGLIHGDVFHDNVLFTGRKFDALIDFEEACHYYKVFDLGMAVVGLCIDNSEVNLNKVRSLADGYQTLSSLTQAEKELLQLFVEYAAIATSSWRFWKYKIDTPTPAYAEKHLAMVQIADFVHNVPKPIFMQAVFS